MHFWRPGRPGTSHCRTILLNNNFAALRERAPLESKIKPLQDVPHYSRQEAT